MRIGCYSSIELQIAYKLRLADSAGAMDGKERRAFIKRGEDVNELEAVLKEEDAVNNPGNLQTTNDDEIGLGTNEDNDTIYVPVDTETLDVASKLP